jgi:DNA-binding response OmpR family regulator
VTLPLQGEPAQPAGVRAGAGVDAGPARRVLVADDNTDAALMLAATLRLAAHDVRTAHDGVTAWQIAQGFRPDVAILDIGMPGMDGYQLALRLREQFGTAIRLLALTGWGQEMDRQRAREAGFDRHLTKPVDVSELHRAINPAERQDPPSS